ncbi:MAG TPA: DedA family protein [Burkholderiaceae bacterium]
MFMPQLLADYGYLAVFVGSFLEGETILVLAGFAAHQGYLAWPWVVALAFCGGALGDQVFFFVGRRHGAALLRRLPYLARGAPRINRLLLRHHAGLIIGVRFMYGLRIVGPVVIGMSAVPAIRFLAFNLIGAALWANLIAGIGYLFGHSLQWLLADMAGYEAAAVVLILLIAVLIGVVHRLRTDR